MTKPNVVKYTYVPKDWDINERPDWVKIPLTNEERNSPSINKLLRMFTYKRPAWSPTEERFIADFIDCVEGMQSDDFGNRYCYVDHEDGTPSKVMWSSHTDTVHNTEGKQRIRFTNDVVRLKDKTKSNCLGADDTSGVWLMLEMIEHGIPGLYIFHRAEEIGGKGSRYLADNHRALLEGIDVAIAFDRRGYKSIISRQGGVCCSQEFVLSLGDMLALPMYDDKTGTFTDTASYTHLIAECTNLSVGYHNAHRSNEVQDVRFLMYLLEAILLNWDETQLDVVRNPLEDSFWKPRQVYKPPVYTTKPTKTFIPTVPKETGASLTKLIKDYPHVAAKILEEYGVGRDEFEEEIFKDTGFMPLDWFN